MSPTDDERNDGAVRHPPESEYSWHPFSGGVLLEGSNDSKLWRVLHTQYTISVIRRGAADWVYRGKRFTAAPGAVLICEPGEVHATVRAHCPGDFTALFLDPQTLPEVGEELGFGAAPHFRPEGLVGFELWAEVARLQGLAVHADLETQHQALSEIVSKLCLQGATRSVGAPPASLSRGGGHSMDQARRLIADSFASDPTTTIRLRPIAAQVGVPYHALIHSFRRRFGVAPYEYLDALRARTALEAIRRGPTRQCGSLTALAAACGYSDGPHMTRSFRKHWAYPPLLLARKVNADWLSARSKRPGRSYPE